MQFFCGCCGLAKTSVFVDAGRPQVPQEHAVRQEAQQGPQGGVSWCRPLNVLLIILLVLSNGWSMIGGVAYIVPIVVCIHHVCIAKCETVLTLVETFAFTGSEGVGFGDIIITVARTRLSFGHIHVC